MDNAGALSTAIDLYKSSATMVGNLWSLYTVAALGLLGYVLGTRQPLPGRAKIGLAAGFAVFAVCNGAALYRAQAINRSASETINQLQLNGGVEMLSIQGLLSTLSSIRGWQAVGLQAFFSVAALAAVYFAHRHDRLVA